MATTLQHKRSNTAGNIPSTSSLALGELAVNTAQGFVYLKVDDGVNPEEIYRLRGEPLSEIAVIDDQFTGDGVTTQFNLSRVPEDEQFVFVTINGVLQHTDAYSISGAATLDFSVAPANGDAIEARIISVTSSALSLRDYTSYIYTITTSTTIITGADDAGATLSYEIDKVEVFYNGVKLVPGYDYTTNAGGTTITLLQAVSSGTIEVVSLAKASFIDNKALAPYSATLSTTNAQLVDRFQVAAYRSAKYFVQMTNGTDYHVTEVLLLHDDTDIYLTEYGTMYSNNSLGTVSADIVSGYVRLLVTPANATTTTVKGHRITVTV